MAFYRDIPSHGNPGNKNSVIKKNPESFRESFRDFSLGIFWRFSNSEHDPQDIGIFQSSLK